MTILLTVLTINAVNFIDGLDGLAAGVTAIAAGAFFAFSYHLAAVGLPRRRRGARPCSTAALAGTCLGFLPHNFFPARIFMGDSGSMLVGLMLSAAATTADHQRRPAGVPGRLGVAAARPAAAHPAGGARRAVRRPAARGLPPRPPRRVAVRAGQAAPAPPAARARAQPPAGRAAAVLLVGAASPSAASRLRSSSGPVGAGRHRRARGAGRHSGIGRARAAARPANRRPASRLNAVIRFGSGPRGHRLKAAPLRRWPVRLSRRRRVRATEELRVSVRPRGGDPGRADRRGAAMAARRHPAGRPSSGSASHRGHPRGLLRLGWLLDRVRWIPRRLWCWSVWPLGIVVGAVLHSAADAQVHLDT